MGFGSGSGRYPASYPLNHEPAHPHWESLILVKLISSSASKTIISYSLSSSLYYGNTVFPFFVGRLTMVIIKLCCYFPHLLLGLLIDR